MSIVAELAQTFFVDPTTVKNAPVVFLTSIDLYFGKKPARGNTSSNLPAPGVTIFVVPTAFIENEYIPILNTTPLTTARVEYDNINVSTSSATATTFTFDIPYIIPTGRMLAIVIKFDGADTGFALWRNKASEIIEATGTIATPVTKGALDGKFFVITNGTIPTPLHDSDLKISINAAKFSTTSKTYRVVNRSFEFIRFNTSTLTGNFQPGELVFANTGFPAAQTVSVSATSKTITGTGTTFQTTYPVGSYIVLNSGTANDIKEVISVTNNTVLSVESYPSFTNATAKYLNAPIGKVFDYAPESNTLILVASTANSTVYFTGSQTVHGQRTSAKLTISSLFNYPIDAFNTEFKVYTPPGTTTNTVVKLANSTYYTNSSNTVQLAIGNKTEFREFGAIFASRSNEVQNSTYLNNSKSVNFNLTFNTTNPYVSPTAYENDLNFFSYKYDINNTIVNENKASGQAKAKFVSKKIILADGQDAEDLKVYISAYKPQYTDIVVYCKLWNSADPKGFDTEDWSYMELATPRTLLSVAGNTNDYIELEYKLPNWPIANTSTMSSGTQHEARFTGTNGSAVITGSTLTVNTFATANIQPNDLVRIFDPLTPNNSLVAAVLASNTSTFTIDTTLSSSNTTLSPFVRTGMSVEKVTYKNAAYNNYINSKVVRYYNSDMSAFDTYKVFAIKIVLLSSNTLYRPVVDNVRGIALTA